MYKCLAWVHKRNRGQTVIIPPFPYKANVKGHINVTKRSYKCEMSRSHKGHQMVIKCTKVTECKMPQRGHSSAQRSLSAKCHRTPISSYYTPFDLRLSDPWVLFPFNWTSLPGITSKLAISGYRASPHCMSLYLTTLGNCYMPLDHVRCENRANNDMAL